MRTTLTHLPSQRGTTLIEALIATLVLSLGMLATARLQSHLRLNSDVARQRSEAVRLAQADIETLRSFNVVATIPDLVDVATSAPAGTYEVTRHIGAGNAATLTVRWTDRAGGSQQVALDSIISRTSPTLSAALTLAPGRDAVNGAFGRSARIPLEAKDLGNGSSALKPVGSGAAAIVFSNATGQITASCSGVDAGISTQQLALSNLGTCSAVGGLLLSGQVRFSNAAPPNAARANDPAMPLAVELALTGRTDRTSAHCSSEAQKRVAFTSSAGTRRIAVPVDAAPASVGVSEWTDLGERFVAYHCVVTPLNGRWSGRSTVTPQGWALGLDRDAYRICRYTADQDGSGTIDTNAEHPDHYSDVDTPLAQQNFLVIHGDQLCPVAPGDPMVSNHNTVQHQP